MLEELRTALAGLVERRAAAVDGMETVAATARAEESRSLTTEEDAEFVAFMGEITEIDAEMEAVEARIGQLEAIEERTQIVSKIPPFNVARTDDPFDLTTLRYDAGRAELHGRVRRILDEDNQQVLSLTGDERSAVDDLLNRVDTFNAPIAKRILITGRNAYKSAFTKAMSDNDYALDGEERQALAEMRAASLTDSQGGYALPFVLDPTIIDTGSGSVNPFRNIGTVRQIVSDTWQGVSSGGVTASWDAEGAQVSDDAPTLAQPAIPVYKAQVFVPYSIEVGMDWANMESDVRSMFSVAKDDLEATAHATGSGTAQPTGLVTALNAGSATTAPATAEVFAIADVYALEQAVTARYRTRGQFVANKAFYNLVRQFDTGGGAAMWERIGAGQPAELLGYPAHEASAMEAGPLDATATDTNYVMIFGDTSHYFIIDRIGMVVDRIPHLFHTSNNRPSGQSGLYGFWRSGADSVNDSAMSLLSIPTTA